MKFKSYVFADNASFVDKTKSDTDLLLGWNPMYQLLETVDINGNLYSSDFQLKIVSDELCQILDDFDVNIDPNDSAQVSQILRTKLGNTGFMTGIDIRTAFTAPFINANGEIEFTDTINLQLNNYGFSGVAPADFTEVSILAQVISCPSGNDGVLFLYCDNLGNLNLSTSKIAPVDGATKCLLGSVFRYNNAFQSGSFIFNPWLEFTSQNIRESEEYNVANGLISSMSLNELQIGDWSLSEEGVNVSTNISNPNIKDYTGSSYNYKLIYPGYNPGTSSTTILDTTHQWFIDTQTLSDISGQTGFIIMIPCFIATGQLLFIASMGNSNYDCIYNSMSEAIDAIYTTHFDLTGVGNRLRFFNQAVVVKIGATNLLDITQCRIINQMPNELVSGSFNGSASAVTGVTIYDNQGNQISQLNAINGFQASDSINLIVNGTRVTFDCPVMRRPLLSPMIVPFELSGYDLVGEARAGTTVSGTNAAVAMPILEACYSTGISYGVGTIYSTLTGLKIATADKIGLLIAEFDSTDQNDANVLALDTLWNSGKEANVWLIDSVNQVFMCPRIRNMSGVSTNVGEFIPESLPNLTGQTGFFHGPTGQGGTGSGALRTGPYSGNTGGRGSENRHNIYRVLLDAAGSSSTYQTGANVQQNASGGYVYFRIYDAIRASDNIVINDLSQILTEIQNLTYIVNNLQGGIYWVGSTPLTLGLEQTELTNYVVAQESRLPQNGDVVSNTLLPQQWIYNGIQWVIWMSVSGTNVIHDNTLSGTGTQNSPLGVSMITTIIRTWS